MASYQSAADSIRRQRMIAQALRESGNQALPDSLETGGRFRAPVSGWQYASKAIEKIMAGLSERDANKAQKALDEADQAELKNVLDSTASVEDQGYVRPTEQIAGQQMPDASAVEQNQNLDADRKSAMRAAAIRGVQFGGSAAPIAGELLKRDILPPQSEPFTLGEGDTRFDANGKPIAAGQPKQYKDPQPQLSTISIIDKTKPGGYQTIFTKDFDPKTMNEWIKPTAAAAGGPTEPLDPDTVALAVSDVAQDPNNMKTYAPFGAAGLPHRDQINKAVAARLRASGMTPGDLQQARARFKGELKSTAQLTAQGNAVSAYEKVAKANGQRLLDLVGGIDATGVPVAEAYIRKMKNVVGGSENVAEFMSVMNAYQTEAARILNNPNLTGVLSDSAREDMKQVVNGSMTAPQLRRVINRIDFEMDLRRSAIGQQLQTSGSNIDVLQGNPNLRQDAPPVNPANPVVAPPASSVLDDNAILNKYQ